MANYKVIANNGNINALSTWQDDNTGSYQNSTVLPSATDICYCNGLILTVNVNYQVALITTASATNVNAGGRASVVNGVILTADCVAGTTYCVTSPSTGATVTIIGDVTGGTSTNAFGISGFAGCTFNVIGNITGGSGTNAHGYYSGTGTFQTVNHTGNAINGTGGRAIYDAINTTTLNLNGTYTSGALEAVMFSNVVNAIGIFNASATASAISNVTVNVGQVVAYGVFNNLGGRMAIYAPNIKIDTPTPTVWTFQKPDNTDIILYTEDAFNYAIEADTRDGVTYANGTKTGTLKVAPPSLVVKDVPTDDTVGTWAFDSALIARMSNAVTEQYLTTELGNLTI